MAGPDGAARFQSPRAIRPRIHRRRQHAPPSDDATSRPGGIHGALRGRIDRALRRRVSTLAGAGTGAGDSNRRRSKGFRALGRRQTESAWSARAPRRPFGNPQLPDPRRRGAQDSVYGRRRETRSRVRCDRAARQRCGQEAGSDAGRRFPGPRRGRAGKQGAQAVSTLGTIHHKIRRGPDMRRLSLALPATLFLCVTLGLSAQQTTVLRAARLIDGTGAAPITNAAIVVTDDRIVAVGPGASVAVPAGAHVIDLGDVTLLPGFIDAHTHIIGRTLGDPLNDLAVVKDYAG